MIIFIELPMGMFFFVFVLSLIPYGLIILGKWIIYGTFNIFKIGQDIKPKKGERGNKDDEWKTEWKN